MKRFGYLEISNDTLKKLIKSKELRIYRDKEEAFIEQREEITQFVILINENGILFRVENAPFNDEDDIHWEIDRLSITVDLNTQQEELIFISKCLNPQLRLYRENYEVGSRIQNEIDNIEADSALYIGAQDKSIFICCYNAASLEITYIDAIPDGYREIDIKKFLSS
ncbi:hypothetical protein KFD70_06490 [Bacillus pfraonensis]|uniref:hypothetical protein n=1 Tax=Bacillus TaxID=1386 RepID=UPI002A50EFD9|nr:hypothetical protein [Bacillus pseudomycoides]